ncbi:MAG: Asp-tRNA(Asn)/Glu-tRNA(Gln) amidotransferase subunit GatB [Candidatus Saccharimonadales bacterium]
MLISEDIIKKYDLTVGIECHVQLATNTKLFSGANNDERGKSPNSVVSPIDYAFPGMLPVLNYRAIELAILAGKVLNSDIARISRFDRKHYFYPDLPKGYQISQMYQPIIGSGYVDVPMEDGSSFKVRINHAHLEEDAGKLTHVSNHSLVDLNRAGTPLIEIVSEPDIHTPAQAKAYAMELYKLMTYAGVTRGDLYHGNMRFDVNVSIAPIGSETLGVRSEMKNLNSFKSVERAVDYEFKRQIEILKKGDKVIQETRGWDENRQRTFAQRSKENAQDYRYMPDPDIPPVVLGKEDIQKIQSQIPKLPSFYRNCWKSIGFNDTVINALLLSRNTAEYAQNLFDKLNDNDEKIRIGLWILDLSGFLPEESGENYYNWSDEIPVSDDQFIELSNMVKNYELSSTAAKEILFEMIDNDESPRNIAIEKNLIQVSDESKLLEIIDEVISDPASEQAIIDLKNGQEKVIGFLVGQVMRKSGGKANPSKTQELIKERVFKKS